MDGDTDDGSHVNSEVHTGDTGDGNYTNMSVCTSLFTWLPSSVSPSMLV
jgi:hypothetical protein